MGAKKRRRCRANGYHHPEQCLIFHDEDAAQTGWHAKLSTQIVPFQGKESCIINLVKTMPVEARTYGGEWPVLPKLRPAAVLRSGIV
jgi:hypothetical protein